MTEQDPQVGGDRSGTDRTGVDRPAGGRDGGPARGGSGRGGSGRDGGERGGYGRSDRGGGGDRSGSGRGAGRDRDGAGRGGSGRDGAERGGRDAGGRGGTGRSGSDRGRPGGADRGGHGRGDHDGRDHGGRDGRGRDGAGRGGSGWSDRGRSGSADRGGSGRGDRGGADRGGRAGAGRADGDRGGSGGGFGRSDRGGPRGGAGRGGFDRSDRGGPGDRSGSGRGRPDGRAGSDRPGSDRPGHDRPGHDRSGHDRSGGDVARGRTRPDDRGRTPDRGRPDDRGPRRTDRDAARGGRTGAGPRNAGPPRGRVGPGRPPSVDQARLAAYELLTAVRERDAYANLALPGILRRLRLRDRDAALATELGYGTLRAQGLLDAVIDACTDRPLSKIEHPLLDALRLGAYQLLRTRVPPHAAVDTCVELVRGEAGSRSAGFVNAVLRRIGEHDEAAWLDRLAPDPAEDPVGSAALRHAHPVWIARAFADALGTTGDELVEALAADDTRPVVHLLARPGDISAEELALTTGGEPAPFSPYGVHLEPGAGDVGELEPVADGLALVQDEGSQLAALALTRAEPTGPDGGRWLDLCAGPGGKTALLGGVAQLSGATVDAVEVAEHRAELVRAAVADLPVTVHTADGRSAPLPDDTFDRVLVDAPCTGLGALRRRPEARWRRGPEDITELATLQRELLLAGLRHVRPGGVVAYVTCSPHLSETVGVLARALRRGTPLAEVERLDVRAALPEGMPGLGDGPTVQLWPHRHGTDAMFIALLRRPTG